MKWELVSSQAQLEELAGRVWEGRVLELYGHRTLPSEQPSGASSSGRGGLDVRVLVHGRGHYMEIVFDLAEVFAIPFFPEIYLKGQIDSLGRFQGSLGHGGETAVRAARVRYRFVDDLDLTRLYFRTPDLLPNSFDDLGSIADV